MLTNFKRAIEQSEFVLVLLFLSVALGSFFLGRMSGLATTGGVAMSGVQAAVIEAKEGNMPANSYVPAVSEESELSGVESVPASSQDSGESQIVLSEAGYVASKSGTKYHLPWCSGAKRIKEENKIWFATKEAAEAAGYTPAANCKGI